MQQVIIMESANRDEAERCLEKARLALKSGKIDYAYKLALKSLRLCSTPEGIGKKRMFLSFTVDVDSGVVGGCKETYSQNCLATSVVFFFAREWCSLIDQSIVAINWHQKKTSHCKRGAPLCNSIFTFAMVMVAILRSKCPWT